MQTVQVGREQNSFLDAGAIPVDPDLQQRILKQEAFMAEIVEVYVYPSASENDPPHFILNVNGINQPVFRGSVTKMRRAHLEVLARMKETKFSQNSMNYMNPDQGNALIPRTAQVYPFEVRNDPNPIGRVWLDKLMREPS